MTNIINNKEKDSPAVLNDYLTVPKNWKAKAIACIAARNNYSTTLDILSCVMGADAFNSLSADERLKNVTQLSTTLSNLVKNGYLKKAKMPGMKGNYYGLPQWFEVNGAMKKQYADATLYYLINNDCCCD